jgi:hypothetical protein
MFAYSDVETLFKTEFLLTPITQLRQILILNTVFSYCKNILAYIVQH